MSNAPLSRPSKIITRFAPSPTGFLHLGHAYAAYKAFEFAREHGGQCLLRIEDTDFTRCRRAYVEAIFEDLTWLGFTWPTRVRVQSHYRVAYDRCLDILIHKGVLYRCFKTRQQIPAGTYRGFTDPQEQARLDAGEPYAWRLSIERCQNTLGIDTVSYPETGNGTSRTQIECPLSTLSDEVVARKDIGTSYLLASTHDDYGQRMTHVVRGEDIQSITPYQVLIQNLMGWKTPTYCHHPVIKNDKGQKLSKRNEDTTIRSLRAQGVTPEQLFAMAGL